PTATWTDKEIETALMQCVQALAPLTADVDSLAPIRSGDCGASAPVLLKSIGDADKVSFDPPLVLNCAMVAGLDRWLRDSVQPAAREVFSARFQRSSARRMHAATSITGPMVTSANMPLPMPSMFRCFCLGMAEGLTSRTAGVRLSAI